MKTPKTAIKSVDFRVWCSGCCIRIAPHQEQIAVDGKAYHWSCYSKHFAAVSKGVSNGKSRG